MFDETIDEKYIVYQEGTSEGTQIKYKKDGYWYKLDSQGNEGLCEYLASTLLQYSDLKPDEYIRYEQGLINGRPGCRSKDFLEHEDEELVTIYRLYYNEYGRNLAEVLAGQETMEERIAYTTQFVKKSTGCDITDYLKKTITLDRLILNEDRHVNNLALIGTDSGFRAAPIFDNGKSLLTANPSFNKILPLSENVKRVIARPFSGSFQQMYDYFGAGFKIDVSRALSWLENEPESREKSILMYQLKTL
ncbi:MAG: hypothetical protein IKO61_06590 [Lachnospiraceae bacterium]|nr:hypothetical protein [Lachnospiraceae bacterium]